MKKILVVDNEWDTAMYIKTVLEEEGYSVETVLSGKECFEKLRNNYFDVVTLDIFIPDVSGWEILKKLEMMRNLKNCE